ncbi:hypothetical protein [Mesorhizobium loti]|uniref:Uncharacterized protein n=1 Tax=Rhizobium loti TaxID=381 RepID=A0A6M7U699_RHILI|nr:hypothetical protein [Mesorhizobium loti]OBQ72415.1 hypothetical protein A8145_06295 [Mesorhizobium loti]QKC71980.1 hypothetical protein EB815_24655 [Mesorhizobium loti]
MGTRAAEIVAKPVTQDQLAGDPLAAATRISNGILKAAETKTTAKPAPTQPMDESRTPSTGVAANNEDVFQNPLIRAIAASYRSDYFPVLLILVIYTLFAFGAALCLLMWRIAESTI